MENVAIAPQTDRYQLIAMRDISYLVHMHRALEGWIQMAVKMAEAVQIAMKPFMMIAEMMRAWQEGIAVRLSQILVVSVPTVRVALDQLPAIPASRETAVSLGLIEPSQTVKAPLMTPNAYSAAKAEGTINGKDFFFSKQHYAQFFSSLVESGEMTQERAFDYLKIDPNGHDRIALLHESLKAIRKTTGLKGDFKCRGGSVLLQSPVQLK